MIKGTPDKQTVGKILDRLSKDHDFREQFIGDPAGALKQYGVEVDPDKIPAVRMLPSKEQVVAIREKAAGIENPIEKVGLFVFMLK